MNFTKIYWLGFVFVIALISCDSKKKEQGDVAQKEVKVTDNQIVFTNDQYQLADIEIGKPELRNLSNLVKLTGVIKASPKSNALVSAQLGGYVKDIDLMVGENVRKGQLLARIENKQFIDLQKEYLVNRSRYSYLQKEFDRQKELRESNVNSKKKFQQVKSDLEATKAKMMSLKQTLSLIGINAKQISAENIASSAALFAPIGGVIQKVNVLNGEYVEASKALFSIVNTEKLTLNLKAFEKDVNAIAKGQEVAFSLASNNQFEHQATVKLIGRSLSKDRTIDVICEITPTENDNWVPGMYVKAWLSKSESKEWAVSNDAIVKYQGSDFVIGLKSMVKNNYLFQLIPVRKKTTQGNWTGIQFPSKTDINNLRLVTKNAYAIIAAKINSEEEE
ncbi:efflux RND transporter periplasmic adaptor subunit [Prolixibacteraceae bacterium JC049]|nr:efflux RND transporter periplasmic adaptor subunit [Prolixibacteraceae bacterium JC049]